MEYYKNLDLKNIEGEYWKVIDGNEYYQISSLGRLKSMPKQVRRGDKGYTITKERIKKSRLDSDGYVISDIYFGKRVSITIKIHRMVAKHFIPNIDNKSQVNHKNGIKSDNRIENLEWVTIQENNIHAMITGLWDSNGENCVTAKLTNDQVSEMRDLYKSEKYLQKELAEMFNVSKQTAHNIVRHKQWKHV